jgi:ATP-dependent DNA ligase
VPSCLHGCAAARLRARSFTLARRWCDGAAVFAQACRMGLEGIVSKRLSAPYRSGPSRDWIKVKNPDSPAMIRAREAEW